MAATKTDMRLTNLGTIATERSTLSPQGKLKMHRPDSIAELIYKENNKGYRVELVDKDIGACALLRKLTICGRCAGVLNKPCLMRRIPQMIVCTSCLHECEREVTLTTIEEAILDLEASCPLRDRECRWHGNLGALAKHMDSCEELIVGCPQKCNSVMERKNAKLHMENECEKRMSSCKHCKVQHYLKDTQTHSEKCEYFPIRCTCGEQVKRKDYQTHKQDTCKQTVVECRFKRDGCEATFRRGDRATHEQENEMKHVYLRMDKLDAKIQYLEERNEALENEIKLFEEVTTYALVLNWKLDLNKLKGSGKVDGPTFTIPNCSIKFYTKQSLDKNVLTLVVSVWPINSREAFSYDFWTIFVDQNRGKLCKTRDGHYRCFNNKEIDTNSPFESTVVIARIPAADLNKENFNKNGTLYVRLFTKKHLC